jgi:hypothetical protein
MRTNAPFLTWNRGLISPKSLGRVDVDRTRLSAETYTNFLPFTQGAMTIRPGTKYFGSSLNDTGAYFIEFVAATDDTALLEVTDGVMRYWLGSDSHNLEILERPHVDTVINDTGWDDESTGGGSINPTSADQIPTMTGSTTDGVTISASDETVAAWYAADDSLSTGWYGIGSVPHTLTIDFGSGNTKKVSSYTIRSTDNAFFLGSTPRDWTLESNDVDTGAGWTTEDTVTNETGWSVSEKRTFDAPGVNQRRYWRLNISAVDGGSNVTFNELELIGPSVESSDLLTLNAHSIGGLAKATKTVVVDTGDQDVEHSLYVVVSNGRVTLRVGSSAGDDDYISETRLGSGYHNLAFTPSGNFYITFQSDKDINKIVTSCSIGDSGTVELISPWSHADLDYIRFDQSADIIYVACDDVKTYKVERRGTGRSWSIVEYRPNDGPFFPAASSFAKLSIDANHGNATITSDIPFFTANHVGSLIRMRHEGQSGRWLLGAKDAKTDGIKVTGLSDTGKETGTSERTIIIDVTGTWSGTIAIERSVDGEDIGFKAISTNLGTPTDTGTFSSTITDQDDNLDVWYRARITSYTSGVANVDITYPGGAKTGIARITEYASNTSATAEILRRFSDTGYSDNWQEGYWSNAQTYPSAVALHGGRLCFANGGNLFMSVSDDYEGFDDLIEGDAAPLIKTLGSGPVNNIHFLLSALRLIVGTSGAELSARSSSLDEPITPSTANIRVFSTQGSANLRAIRLDTKALFVQRSGQRVFVAGFGLEGEALGDYQSQELTLLVPDLLNAGVVSVAIQRQPDTRLHCVLSDGTVGLMTYQPQEQVLCWTVWETTNGAVERAMVLPGIEEDAVYYHVRRTINGATKRFLEKWALLSEGIGDTGLSWIADCAVSYTDTGRTSTITGVSHLAGESVVVWADDTGQTSYGKDLSPDVNGVQTTYVVDTGSGSVTLSENVHHAVMGLPYTADWKSSKLTFGAEAGTALSQIKRVAQMALVLYNTHNNGLFFGSDTGNLDALPRVIDGATVDDDKIHGTLDSVAIPFPGEYNTDARFVLRAKAPRPVTIIAATPSVQTNERV